jgi:succinylarginine dihydrolase
MLAVDHKMADRNQKTVTLSDKAMEEYELVASWKGIPVASLLRQVLEDHHESPTFGALVRRAKSGDEGAANEA